MSNKKFAHQKDFNQLVLDIAQNYWVSFVSPGVVDIMSREELPVTYVLYDGFDGNRGAYIAPSDGGDRTDDPIHFRHVYHLDEDENVVIDHKSFTKANRARVVQDLGDAIRTNSVPSEDCYLAVDMDGRVLEEGDVLVSNVTALHGSEPEVRVEGTVEYRDGKLVCPIGISWAARYFVQSHCRVSKRFPMATKELTKYTRSTSGGSLITQLDVYRDGEVNITCADGSCRRLFVTEEVAQHSADYIICALQDKEGIKVSKY